MPLIQQKKSNFITANEVGLILIDGIKLILAN